MSTVEQARDHARAMSTAEHKPTCCRCGKSYCCGCIGHPNFHPDVRPWFVTDAGDWPEHAETCPSNPAAPPCPGCVTDDDRAAWARLADEYDAILGQIARMQEEQLW